MNKHILNPHTLRRFAALLLALLLCAAGASAEALPAAATPDEAQKETVSQFSMSVSQSDGKITAVISGASSREIEVTILRDGAKAAVLSLIGSGSVTSGVLEAGVYNVQAAYVTPAEGVSSVTKTIEIPVRNTPTPTAAPTASPTPTPTATPGPTVSRIEARADVGSSYITITVLRADNWPLYAAVGSSVKEIVNGQARFDNLAAGSYDVEVDYITPVPGVSPYRTTVTVGASATPTPPPANQGITITLVLGGENQLVVCGTARANSDVTLSTKPASETPVIRADASGSFAAVIRCAPGTYTGVYAQYGSDKSTRARKIGSFVVTPSATPTPQPTPTPTPGIEEKPPLTVEPIYSSTLKVYARSKPGTLVNLGVQGYGQTVTADANGYLVYSLPQTYPNGTVVTFTVFYGKDNTLSYPFKVTVGAKSNYRTLYKGCYGEDVLMLTERLQQLGYPITPSMTYTVDTAEVVRMFQRRNGLTVDGLAGKKTQTALYSINAIGMEPPQDDNNYVILRRSTRYNAAVVPLQRRLRELGYPVGKADGYFGSQTYRAVLYFQRVNGLSPANGIATPAMQSLLYSSDALRYDGGKAPDPDTGYRLLYWGSKGEQVRRLQNALLAAGYKQVRVADGIFGQWTYEAVVAFQKDHGLLVDGIAGKQTQNALYGTNY
ncbi:MAG: peptidoglycan-binding protein [Clostridia bacterium]|nr:peptidoglycan-binding protein [Clostridia bacterium]